MPIALRPGARSKADCQSLRAGSKMALFCFDHSKIGRRVEQIGILLQGFAIKLACFVRRAAFLFDVSHRGKQGRVVGRFVERFSQPTLTSRCPLPIPPFASDCQASARSRASSACAWDGGNDTKRGAASGAGLGLDGFSGTRGIR